eukprot:4197013-Pyramimonas_sp.AAC.2
MTPASPSVTDSSAPSTHWLSNCWGTPPSTSPACAVSNLPPAPASRPISVLPHKPRSRLSASQWQSVGREYTSNIRWNIRNAVR